MLKKNFFHYTSVLGVIHDRILDDEAYDLLSFLAGYNVCLNNFTVARGGCLSYLQQTFPKLGNIHVIEAFRELDDIQEGDILCNSLITKRWLIRHNDIFLVYGKMIEIEKIKQNAEKRANNILYLRNFIKSELGW
ncbi:MAG: hypothetical protein UZ19_OD1000453 [Parcubacteria bacterium OLB19]|nr:MAG: hypothetical protein UZ19_OD1000453 [Parcubacteria bacterium OLB19]